MKRYINLISSGFISMSLLFFGTSVFADSAKNWGRWNPSAGPEVKDGFGVGGGIGGTGGGTGGRTGGGSGGGTEGGTTTAAIPEVLIPLDVSLPETAPDGWVVYASTAGFNSSLAFALLGGPPELEDGPDVECIGDCVEVVRLPFGGPESFGIPGLEKTAIGLLSLTPNSFDSDGERLGSTGAVTLALQNRAGSSSISINGDGKVLLGDLLGEGEFPELDLEDLPLNSLNVTQSRDLVAGLSADGSFDLGDLYITLQLSAIGAGDRAQGSFSMLIEIIANGTGVSRRDIRGFIEEGLGLEIPRIRPAVLARSPGEGAQAIVGDFLDVDITIDGEADSLEEGFSFNDAFFAPVNPFDGEGTFGPYGAFVAGIPTDVSTLEGISNATFHGSSLYSGHGVFMDVNFDTSTWRGGFKAFHPFHPSFAVDNGTIAGANFSGNVVEDSEAAVLGGDVVGTFFGDGAQVAGGVFAVDISNEGGVSTLEDAFIATQGKGPGGPPCGPCGDR